MGITINNNGNCKKSINVNDKNKRFERNYYHKILMAKIWQIFCIPNLYNVLFFLMVEVVFFHGFSLKLNTFKYL